MRTQATEYPSTAWADDLDLFGASPARAQILRFFLMRPDAAPHVREIQRILNLGARSVQRELARLVKLGAIERIEDGGLVRHRACPGAPVWDAVRSLIRQSPDPVACVRAALVDVDGIESAFVFGSVATGTHTEKSDIDIFLITTPGLDKKVLFERLSELSLALRKDVSPVRYTREELERRLGDTSGAGVSFLRASLAGPKRVVRGNGEVIERAISMTADPPEPGASV